MDATAYITQFCLDADEWTNTEEAQQQRLLNVAERVLTQKFSRYVIPPEAVYEFACALSVVFNDTNKMAKQGIQQFSLQGTVTYMFHQKAIANGTEDLSKYIPTISSELIAKANDIPIFKRKIGRSVI